MLVAARWWRASAWRLADEAVPAVAAGVVLVRIGCFLNGCCPGLPTDLPWGVTYAYGSTAWSGQLLSGGGGILGLAGHVEPVHPTQLYEVAAALLCLAVALAVRRRPVGPGIPALVFATTFLAFRVVNQTLRQATPGAAIAPDTTLLIDVAVALVAALMLARHLRHRADMSFEAQPAFA